MRDDFHPRPAAYVFEEMAQHIAARIAAGDLPPSARLPAVTGPGNGVRRSTGHRKTSPRGPTTPQHAYTVYLGSPQGDVALAETYIGETAYTGEDAAKLERILDLLWEDAAEGDEARQLITDAAEQVRRILD